MATSHRVIPIVLAYAASCAVAGTVLVLALALTGESGGWAGAWRQIDLELAKAFFSLVALVGSMVAMLALVPTLAVGIYTERHRIRSPVFYAAAGVLAGLVGLGIYVAALLWTAPPGGVSLGEGELNLKGLAAGFVGLVAMAGLLAGLTYWAIAGRHAGGG